MVASINEHISINVLLSFQSQWKNNKGKCGLCGDPWNKPRDHEFGGKYFTNHILSTYQKSSVINLTVFTNINPSGWMEFRLLPYETEISSISNNYLLHIGDSRTWRYRVRRSGYHVVPVRLPTDLECERCILQWKFHTGIRCYGLMMSKHVIKQRKRRTSPTPPKNKKTNYCYDSTTQYYLITFKRPINLSHFISCLISSNVPIIS